MFSWLGTASIHLALGPSPVLLHSIKARFCHSPAACPYPSSHLFLSTLLRGKVIVEFFFEGGVGRTLLKTLIKKPRNGRILGFLWRLSDPAASRLPSLESQIPQLNGVT